MGSGGGKWEEVFCTGTFERNLDDKQRLLVPKPVKKTLDSERFFVAPGFDNCLELHNEESIRERACEVEKSQATSRDRKSFSRLYFAQAEACELDSQNRIRIPQRLIDWAGLGTRLTILGVGAHWEIWNEENWSGYCAENRTAFDQIAQAIEDEVDSNANETSSERSPSHPR